ncbi:MAG: aminotransferase class I/II-fold pyridoxal phosphate-dependent enzyme, partial [Thermomicrobiales bacterium]
MTTPPSTAFTAPESMIRAGIEPVTGYRPGASDLGSERSARLDWNESPFGLSPKAQAAQDAYATGNRYPDYMQAPLRDALATYSGVDVDRIIPGAGLDDVFQTLAMLIINPGDEVIIHDPTFGVYRSLFSLHGATIVNVPLGPAPDFALDVDGIIGAVTERTKLVIVCQPNNPTGHLFPRADVERIIAAVPCMVAIDEAYAEFSGTSHLDLADTYDNVIVLRTLSKFAGLAGYRVGYGIFPQWTVPYLNRVAPPFFNISAVSSA